MTENKNLIDRVLSGEKIAFAELIEQYKKLVFHIVFRIMNDKEEREDICQDVFIKVYQGLKGFKGDCKLSSWIGKIAYNTSLNHIGKRHDDLWEDMDHREGFLESVNGNGYQPDHFATQNNYGDILRSEIRQLPEQQKIIISLYHFDDLSYQEISEITGLPDGTVKSYLFRARQSLKERLDKKYKSEEWLN